MKFHLIVAQDFGVYSKGQRIHDQDEVQRLSDGPDHVNVTRIVVSDGEHDAYLEELNRIAEEQRKLDEESARQHAPPEEQKAEPLPPEPAPEPEQPQAVEEPLPADDGAGGMRIGGAPRTPVRRRDHHRGE